MHLASAKATACEVMHPSAAVASAKAAYKNRIPGIHVPGRGGLCQNDNIVQENNRDKKTKNAASVVRLIGQLCRTDVLYYGNKVKQNFHNPNKIKKRIVG